MVDGFDGLLNRVVVVGPVVNAEEHCLGDREGGPEEWTLVHERCRRQRTEEGWDEVDGVVGDTLRGLQQPQDVLRVHLHTHVFLAEVRRSGH